MLQTPMLSRRALGLLALGASLTAAASLTGQEPRAASSARWRSPGDGRILAATAAYDNRFGTLSILNTAGQVETKGHAFFEPIGRNGRACVTCHQPADGMSVSVDTIEARWRETNGRDPIFAAIDGSNCPSLPQDDAASHSLLLKRGLFRIPLPWPPRRADGTPVEPEFTIEVVRDPTGCNTHPEYGLTSSSPTVSVYRRPARWPTSSTWSPTTSASVRSSRKTASRPRAIPRREAATDEHDGRCPRDNADRAGGVGGPGSPPDGFRAERGAAASRSWPSNGRCMQHRAITGKRAI